MMELRSRTEGLDGKLAADLVKDTRKVGRKALSKGAAILAKRMRDKLNVRGGPSRPGEPPARVTGTLRKSIGRDRPRRRDDTMSVAVGVGTGKAAERRSLDFKAQGENVFAVGGIHENGGVGADGRRYPPRSFARAAELEAEPEIVAAMAEVLEHVDGDFYLEAISEEDNDEVGA